MTSGGAQVGAAAPRVLRLLSYNIQAGSEISSLRDYLTKGWRQVLPHPSKRANLLSLAGVLRDFDLVGLQEADSGSLRSGFVNQTQYLAESAGFPYWSHQTNRRMVKLAQSANGLLSRYAPDQVIDHPLPGRIPGRGALWVRYGHGETALVVVIAHLSLGLASRRRQLDFIAELIQGQPHAIVMGDFNCRPDAPELCDFLARSGLRLPVDDHKTFPTWRPERGIDHILVSGTLAVESSQVLDLALSDHLPVALTLTLPEACAMPE